MEMKKNERKTKGNDWKMKGQLKESKKGNKREMKGQ